ncbi:MAG TPA: PLP-dependent aminotransferase family protein [Polyangia bacterium]|jgi:2-aminoadipate transaminase
MTGQHGVEELLRSAASDERVVGFAGGLPAAERFPRRALTSAFLRAIGRRDAAALQYAWPEGLAPLRARIAERVAQRGVVVAADDIIVTNGAQQAITLAARLLMRRGATIGVDAVTYPSALTAFRTLGLVPTTATRASILYRMPVVTNPQGAGMDAAARRAVLASGRFIIEDDAYADLHFAGPAPPPLLKAARNRVAYVGTFSKTLGPGLRVGFLIVPRSLQARALRHKADDDLQANSLSQLIVQEYLAHNDFDAFLVRLRRHYAQRARRLMAAVRHHLPSWTFEPPAGGFGLWVRADDRVDEVALLRHSVRAGVSFDPGSSFTCVAPAADQPTTMRLCFSSVAEDAMDEGVQRLARVWRSTVRDRGRAPR